MNARGVTTSTPACSPRVQKVPVSRDDVSGARCIVARFQVRSTSDGDFGTYGHLGVDDLREAVARIGPKDPAPFADILLTAREVANVLRVSTRTVYALCERGELQHVRVMNAVRIGRAAVAAFVESRRE
jgi:excisionase family DNA binding protein